MAIRLLPVCAFALASLTATTLSAGEVTTANGQFSWTATQCTPPATPPTLASPAETPASSMNERVEIYNAHAKAVEAYTKCIVIEARRDAAATTRMITITAQSLIDEEQKKAKALGETLKTSAAAR